MRCGIDIIEIERIKSAFNKYKNFAGRIFTEDEIRRFAENGCRFEILAGMFAAKEAFSKYLGTGIGKTAFRDIEVCHNANGSPYIRLRGVKSDASVSISHCRKYAVAFVTGNGQSVLSGGATAADNNSTPTAAPTTDSDSAAAAAMNINGIIAKNILTGDNNTACGKTADGGGFEPYNANAADNNSAATAATADTLHISGAAQAPNYGGYSRAMSRLIPMRLSSANKGSCGRVSIIAGSKGMTGAAALSALGALRSGAGLVTALTPSSEQPILAVKLTEAMTVPLPHENGVISAAAADTVLENIKNADAAVFGPGLGKGRGILPLLERIVTEFTKTLIIDADGINALSANIDILNRKKCSVILTPHPGEMSRLSGLSIPEIQSARVKTTVDFADRFDVTVALKGEGTVVAARGGKTAVNPSGNCGMATGGTGDVLSGVVAALAAQGCTPYDSAVLGVYLHGLAGDIAAAEKGVHGLIASDLCGALPAAFLETLKFL